MSTVTESAVEREPSDEAPVDERRRQPPGVGRAEADAVRPIVHQLAQVAVVAARHQSALGDHEHPRTEPADLVEHVARHEHASAVVAEPVEQRGQPSPLHRVEPGQRLVEDQHLGIVHECRGHLDPLAHPLGELADRLVADVGEVDLLERPPGHVVGLIDAVRLRRDRHELEGAHVVEQRVLLRHERHPAADRRDRGADRRRAVRPCPATASVSPHIIRNSVDLPAPFGPSSAVTPPLMAKLTSLTATTEPKNFDTPFTAIMPVSGAAGVVDRRPTVVAPSAGGRTRRWGEDRPVAGG